MAVAGACPSSSTMSTLGSSGVASLDPLVSLIRSESSLFFSFPFDAGALKIEVEVVLFFSCDDDEGAGAGPFLKKPRRVPCFVAVEEGLAAEEEGAEVEDGGFLVRGEEEGGGTMTPTKDERGAIDLRFFAGGGPSFAGSSIFAFPLPLS